jgi:desulfoferrodoxin-like iron-binding protein
MTPTAVGTRLRCERCGTEIIVVKATDGELTCCDKPMAPREG